MLFLLVNKQVQAAYFIERVRTAYKNLSIYLLPKAPLRVIISIFIKALKI